MVTDQGADFMHARILSGITGMGNEDDTWMRLIDPNLPEFQYLVPFHTFKDRFCQTSVLQHYYTVWYY
jgi:hypothetical protein